MTSQQYELVPRACKNPRCTSVFRVLEKDTVSIFCSDMCKGHMLGSSKSYWGAEDRRVTEKTKDMERIKREKIEEMGPIDAKLSPETEAELKEKSRTGRRADRESRPTLPNEINEMLLISEDIL